jgi:hypothetical protein
VLLKVAIYLFSVGKSSWGRSREDRRPGDSVGLDLLVATIGCEPMPNIETFFTFQMTQAWSPPMVLSRCGARYVRRTGGVDDRL